MTGGETAFCYASYNDNINEPKIGKCGLDIAELTKPHAKGSIEQSS